MFQHNDAVIKVWWIWWNKLILSPILHILWKIFNCLAILLLKLKIIYLKNIFVQTSWWKSRMSSYEINVLLLLLIIIKNGFELGQFMEQTHPRAVRIMNQLPHLHLKIAHAAVLMYMHLFICLIFSGTYISINLLIY